jgi:hypothetical protein
MGRVATKRLSRLGEERSKQSRVDLSAAHRRNPRAAGRDFGSRRYVPPAGRGLSTGPAYGRSKTSA